MTQPTSLVVGGGVMGLSAAVALAARGADVTLLERASIGHQWASSHGLTRAIRHEYGPDAIYSQMVARSLVLWGELARETGRHLYTETGVLTLGQPDDGQTLAGYDILRAMGLPIERLTAEECRRRFPQFTPEGYGAITYNAVGGMLHADECLLALAQRLRSLGAAVREGVRVARVEADGRGGRVVLADDSVLHADAVVVTAGPWVQEVLPGVRLPVRATRQQVSYFAGLPADSFAVGRFPVFLAEMEYYGFPLVGPGWFKVGAHLLGAEVDPNEPYAPDEHEVEGVRTFLRAVIPAAASAELALVDRCMYDVSPDEDYILDHHPASAGVVIGSGFSGHGFKCGVVVGEMLAALALGEPPAFPLDRFSLARFGNTTARA